MKAWIDETAILTVDTGMGWMSRYELEGLAAGSVVRSAREAGTGCTLRVNGDFFAEATIVISHGGEGNGGDRPVCAFITSLAERDASPSRPFVRVAASELLPFSIRLARVALRISDLEGTGARSLINLGIRFSPSEDAELVVAGIPVAAGKVAVIGENMGIRLTRFLRALPAGSAPRTTASVLAPQYSAEKVADYDFLRPDRFTRRAIVRAADIHLEFIRGWTLRFPPSIEWRLSRIDQLNYGEWLDDAERPRAAFLRFRSATLAREYRKDEPPAIPAKFYVEGADASAPLDAAVVEGIREWVRTRAERDARLPFQIAFDATAAKVLEGDPGFEIGLACLRTGWLFVADLRLGRAAGAEGATVADAPDDSDRHNRASMIMLARFTSPGGGAMDIVYPEDLIDPLLPILGR